MSAATTDLLVSRLGGVAPRHGIVLGSGLGSLVEAITDPLRIPYSDLPSFPVSAVSGHAGELVIGHLGAVPVIVLSGRVHYYESGDANAMRTPIEVLKGLGVTSLILTNSAGSLRDDMPPGSVMRIADHINFSGTNPLIGLAGDDRFVEPVQQWSPSEASPSGIAIQDGTIYVANLRGQRLRAVPLADLGAAVERYVGEYGRLRAVTVTPNGGLWLLTNNTDGRGDPGPDDDRVIAIPAH